MPKILDELEAFLESNGYITAVACVGEFREHLEANKVPKPKLKLPDRILTTEEKTEADEKLFEATKVQDDGESVNFVYNPMSHKWVKDGTANAKLVRHFLNGE